MAPWLPRGALRRLLLAAWRRGLVAAPGRLAARAGGRRGLRRLGAGAQPEHAPRAHQDRPARRQPRGGHQ
eukprot:1817962-Lingulodinium_polyedra.AAC.1